MTLMVAGEKEKSTRNGPGVLCSRFWMPRILGLRPEPEAVPQVGIRVDGFDQLPEFGLAQARAAESLLGFAPIEVCLVAKDIVPRMADDVGIRSIPDELQ
jgi:hypothetical protein